MTVPDNLDRCVSLLEWVRRQYSGSGGITEEGYRQHLGRGISRAAGSCLKPGVVRSGNRPFPQSSSTNPNHMDSLHSNERCSKYPAACRNATV